MPNRPPLDFATLDISEISRLLADGSTSSTDVVDFYLDRIARLNPKLHAFAQVFDEAARRAAEAADSERLAGRALGPLHGIPIAIKDVFHCTGYPTRAGSRAFSIPPTEDSSTAVRRLESAGMIVLGKTHNDEFAYGGWGINTIAGTPWNPWDLDTHRVPGGSSSGSAVAVAAGMVPAALGTDTGGSCRVPAAFCGCVGFKPSYGLIGRGGMVPLSPTLDTPGLLTRSVHDVTLLLDVLVGPDPKDAATEIAQTISLQEDFGAGADDLRIGRLRGADLAHVDREVLDLYEQVLDDLKAQGATVVDFQFPNPIEDYLRDTVRIINTELCENFGHLADPADSKLQPFVRERMLSGNDISPTERASLHENRSIAQAEMRAAMAGIDALITPTSTMPAAPVAEVDMTTPATPYTRLVNYLDLSGLSVPSGHTKSGLPAAVQIIVQLFDDPKLLRIGHVLEIQRHELVKVPPGLG